MRFGRNKTYLVFLLAIIFVIALQLLNVYKATYNYEKPVYPKITHINVINLSTSVSTVTPTTTEQMTTTESYNFSRIFTDISLTCRGNIFLYVIVISDKYNLKQRQKIRQSWASVKFIQQKLISSVFLVSSDQDTVSGHQSLVDESNKYQDIFYSNYTASNGQLLHLNVDAMRLASACSTAQFNLVIKEDMFPNIPLIIGELSENVSLMCEIHKKNAVVRNKNSIYYVSETDYPESYYPTHCKHGSPFIISGQLAKMIVSNYTDSKVWFYDAYLLGILPQMYNATPVAFPESISIIDMRPHFVYLNRKVYGILVNGILLPGRIWKKLMLQMILK